MQPPRNASQMFRSANRLIEAYHMALAPLCRETRLPPMALDILLFVANNRDMDTAGDVCRSRGWKPGIVSVHVDRLVNDGFLERRTNDGDRRKTHLVCTEAARPVIEKGLAQQELFAARLLCGLSPEDLEALRRCLSLISENISDIQKNGL